MTLITNQTKTEDSIMKRFLLIAAIVLGVFGVANVSDVQAGGGHIHSYNNYGYGNSYYNSGYGYGVGGWGGGYGWNQPYWHDTSHYHYHPTTIYQHGNHFHVVPGHYDLHRTGHWHR